MDNVWQCNVSTAISKSSSGTIKKYWRLQMSSQNIARFTFIQWKCQNLSISQGYNVFTFQVPNYISVSPYIYQPGKTFGLTASIVLFPDPIKLLLQRSTEWNLNQCESLVLFVTHQVTWTQDSSNCCPFLGRHFLRVYIGVTAKLCWLEWTIDALPGLLLANYF